MDNINLLYVAFTRAIDIIYGFSVDNPRSAISIGGVLKSALTEYYKEDGTGEIAITKYYNSGDKVFEFGQIPERPTEIRDKADRLSGQYIVSRAMESLKLKLHGENYFSKDEKETREKINYGKLMHEVFEGIRTATDIKASVRRLVIEGKLPEKESSDLEKRIEKLIGTPQVAEWFLPENKVFTEAGILLPSGNARRPDRVILRDGKTIIIDFKFGDESSGYLAQLELYRNLLAEMGYANIEGYIWYVDRNLIVSA